MCDECHGIGECSTSHESTATDRVMELVVVIGYFALLIGWGIAVFALDCSRPSNKSAFCEYVRSVSIQHQQ